MMLKQIVLTMTLAFLLLPMAKGQDKVSEATMKRVYEEVKTPYKYGLVMTGTDPTKMTDCPTIFRMAGKWYMYYFGSNWSAATKGKAWNTFACSYDLVHWTDWTGQPLVEASEPYDNKYAHKSCVIKWRGVVYHYYCSVDKKGNRGIALATSKDLGKSTLQYPTNSLSEVFRNPAPVTLGTYWYWMSNNISPEGAAEDIRAMKKAGVNLAFLSNIGPSTWWNHNHPLGKVRFMGDEWWQTVRSAFKTATEEGVQLGLFNCAGWSQSGGPWVKPEQSMKILVAAEMHVNGNKSRSRLRVPKPAELSLEQTKAMLKDVAGEAQYTDRYADYFEDVRTIAFPVDYAVSKDTAFVAPTFSGLSKRGTAVIKPFTVSFDSDEVHRGPSSPVQMTQFADLSQSADSAIRYYSGTAVYDIDMTVKSLPSSAVYLNLGKVAQMAKVWVNDIYVGGVWTMPYRLDVTGALQKGKKQGSCGSGRHLVEQTGRRQPLA